MKTRIYAAPAVKGLRLWVWSRSCFVAPLSSDHGGFRRYGIVFFLCLKLAFSLMLLDVAWCCESVAESALANLVHSLPLNSGGGPRVVVSTAAFHEFGVRFPVSAVWKKQKMFLPHPRVKVSIVGSLRDREVACSASDRQGSNFESCVWRTVSSRSSHHPQEVLLTQFSLYVHKGGLKPDSFHLPLNSY